MSVTIKSSLDIHIIIAVVVVVVVVEPATGELWSAAASWCTLGHTQAQAPHTVNRDCHREVCDRHQKKLKILDHVRVFNS